jgi:hypothetical protein
LNEEQTKNALILPFINALGYDVHDPFEVAAEFVSDAGKKGRDKIDYAILKDNAPILLIECKACGVPLDKDKCAQLRRYFAAHTSAHIGILTNGIQYSIYSDIHEKNIMDDEPFIQFDIMDFDEFLLPHLRNMSKYSWNIDEVMRSGETLQILNKLQKSIESDFKKPSNEIVRYYIRKVHSGRVTELVFDQFRPHVEQALELCLDNYVDRRLEASKTQHKDMSLQGGIKKKEDIEPTNTETWGHIIARTLLHETVESERVHMRNNRSYCAILLDDNNRKTICRFHNFGEWNTEDPHIGQNAHIVIFSTESGEKFPIRLVDDIYPLKDKLATAVMRLEKRK